MVLPTLRSRAVLALVAVLLTACAAPPAIPDGTPVTKIAEIPGRNTAEWDLPTRPSEPAIGGYDPVAYFPEGGGVARRGSPIIAVDAAGVLYLFASAENRARFIADPTHYEPAHGSWCSWAMRGGTKTEVDPRSFIVRKGRLFLFYDGIWGDTRALWLETDHGSSVEVADQEWAALSGEGPRGGAASPPRPDGSP